MLRLALALFFALIPALPAAAADPVTPAPYVATYAVSYRGLHGGFIQFQLRAEGDTYIFESRAEPSFLARFFVTDNALERSVMRMDAEGVRPISWFTEDGKAGEGRDGKLEFNWSTGRVTGHIKEETVDLPTEPGLQDRLSIQIAVMTALLRGGEPGTIPMVGDDRVKQYTYTRVRSGALKTRGGEFKTVVYESTRPGSDRLSRVWHATEHGYVPVRAEQMRDGKLETVVELVKMQRGGG